MRIISTKGDLMKILKKYVSILLITAMMFTSPFSVWANTTDISTEILYLIFDYPYKHYTFKYFEV